MTSHVPFSFQAPLHLGFGFSLGSAHVGLAAEPTWILGAKSTRQDGSTGLSWCDELRMGLRLSGGWLKDYTVEVQRLEMLRATMWVWGLGWRI